MKNEEEAKRLEQENAVMAEIGRIISSTLSIEDIYERFIFYKKARAITLALQFLLEKFMRGIQVRPTKHWISVIHF